MCVEEVGRSPLAIKAAEILTSGSGREGLVDSPHTSSCLLN